MVNMITALCGYFSGTFVCDTGGTFNSDTPGTFVSDIGGTFEVILSYIFRSFEESDSCTAQFYISEQEKMVIKMLYSPAIKSGLRKEEFMKQFKLS
jgi:hypothetical protein